MKHSLLLLSLGLLLARAGWAGALPADTVQGQTQLVRQISTSLCTHLAAESKTTDVSKLDTEGTRRFVTKLMFAAMSENLDAFQGVLAKSPSKDARALGEQIGQEAMLNLATNCPDSRPLLAQMGMQAAGQPVQLSAAERPVLAPLAQAVCQRLDAENAKAPFEQRTPAARSAAVEQALQAVIMAHGQEVTDYYGEDALENSKTQQEIGLKIGFAVFELCPSYILLVGRDQAQQQRAAAKPAAPAARKPATPARRPAAKPAVKK